MRSRFTCVLFEFFFIKRCRATQQLPETTKNHFSRLSFFLLLAGFSPGSRLPSHASGSYERLTSPTKNFECGDFTTFFENDYIFEFATEVNEENTNENDDLLEETYMTIYVKMINGKTISIQCEGKQTAAVISDKVERRSLIPRDMTYLVHKGKVMSGKKTIEENNIALEMSLRLLGGMEMNEQMATHETDEDREKKWKLEEGKEGKMTKPNDDTGKTSQEKLMI